MYNGGGWHRKKKFLICRIFIEKHIFWNKAVDLSEPICNKIKVVSKTSEFYMKRYPKNAFLVKIWHWSLVHHTKNLSLAVCKSDIAFLRVWISWNFVNLFWESAFDFVFSLFQHRITKIVIPNNQNVWVLSKTSFLMNKTSTKQKQRKKNNQTSNNKFKNKNG